MDLDNQTPVSKFFADDMFVVREAENSRSDEAILWMSFYEIDSRLNIGVYDGNIHQYTHELTGQTAHNVLPFIQAVEADYGVKVPRRFTTLPIRFLELADDSFGIDVELDEEPVECEQCFDTNGNSVKGFYFPAISDKLPASIAVHWNYGCYGGEMVAGDATDPDIVKSALELLHASLESGEVESEMDEVREFISRIESL